MPLFEANPVGLQDYVRVNSRSEAAKKRWANPAERERQRLHRLGKSATEIYGKEKAQEKYKRHSEVLRGRPSEKKDKTFEELYGLQRANELKSAISTACKSRHTILGRKMSAETKLKMRQALLGRKYNRINKSNSLKGRTIEEVLGSHRAAEVRALMSNAKRGKALASSHVEKIKQTLRARWSGHVNPNADLRESKECREWKLACLKRDNYKCLYCGQVGGKLNVHHIKDWKNYPLFRFELSNGLTLCFSCHKQIHNDIRAVRLFLKQLLQYATV